jgi:hypothetical protein
MANFFSSPRFSQKEMVFSRFAAKKGFGVELRFLSRAKPPSPLDFWRVT